MDMKEENSGRRVKVAEVAERDAEKREFVALKLFGKRADAAGGFRKSR